MYGSTPYASEPYGGNASEQDIAAPLISLPFTVYAPDVAYGDAILQLPLISNAFHVFAPESVGLRGRPLAEDIRIMRVRRSE